MKPIDPNALAIRMKKHMALVPDPGAMKLSHPVRTREHFDVTFDAIRLSIGPREAALVQRALEDDTRSCSAACAVHLDPDVAPIFSEVVHQLAQTPGTTQYGQIFTLMMGMRHRILQAPHIRFTDDVAHLLEDTDIADDLEVRMLQVPYPRIFIEFGTLRDLVTELQNPLSGAHILEGAYVERDAHANGHDAQMVTLVGTPVGHDNALDDATQDISIDLSDPAARLRDLVVSAYENSPTAGVQNSPPEIVEVIMGGLKMVLTSSRA